MLWHKRKKSGVTLIEICVVVAIVGVLASIIVPAVQIARESTRRAECSNKLRQLGLAFHQYHDRNNSFPMGTPQYVYPDVGLHVGHSVFVALLKDIEANNLYDSVNFDLNIYTAANLTVQQAGVSALWCPSDSSVDRAALYLGEYQNIPNGKFIVRYASYAGCSGLWYHQIFDMRLQNKLSKTDNGIFFVNSAIRYSDISDGTSQTLLIGEHAHGRLNGDMKLVNHWWFDGHHGDTLFWSLYPINPPQGFAAGSYDRGPYLASAGSFHPGGTNFAFADGSVKFISENIDSWKIDPATKLPHGVMGSATSFYTVSPGTHVGVYQAISTRGNGEIVNPSTY